MLYTIGKHHGLKRNKMDWVQGEKFEEIADFIYNPYITKESELDRFPNTLNINLLPEKSIIYTHTHYAKLLLSIIQNIKDKKFVVITHNSDHAIDNSFNIPLNIIHWFSQNVNMRDERLESIPIGLENNHWFVKIQKKEKMIEKLKEQKQVRNLVYMNHNILTNPIERILPYQVLSGKSYMTVLNGKNGKGFDNYIDNVYNHEFVICPDGNGIDTVRLWESLYMNTIPIVKRSINTSFYEDLPICFIEDWDEITESFLKTQLFLIKTKKWDLEKLTFNYWKTKILAA
jgi:hypothetical protein